MLLLRNIAFYLVFYIGSVFVVSAALASRPLGVEVFRRKVRDWSAWQRWCVVNILGIEVVLDGAPSDEPVLYAMKHESFFEAIDAPRLFDCPSVFAKQELFAIPLWGRAAAAYGLVPVAREKGARSLMAMIRSAKALSQDGRPLVIFPEGTRVPHGERRPLQAGFAGLYKMLGLPVVPVSVNSGPLYHRVLKRKGRITYRFGKPIPPGLKRDEVEARVMEAINSLND
ncbi:lysophospholipid acyltransferase family protein [Qipengyuania marisflavi]|uniref:1-acyl-sn-glycerol-3-phosphate acyltransferase n=1 Tax=Qipengyuania marisflavi TaxID=2486356 RepID=A0A5S3NZL1_9SPHN|nr:lysophospholipid acyltransferase family protein [Qipengyuania marisflavi]TMM45877.1 1-acyl-sn-glycerol-3-phosphate acyltransferase [Qipengyuania marisflavi]